MAKGLVALQDLFFLLPNKIYAAVPRTHIGTVNNQVVRFKE